MKFSDVIEKLTNRLAAGRGTPPPAEPDPTSLMADNFDVGLVGKNFDRAFYLATYPDVAQAGLDPLVHYTSWGWHEGRKPVDWFEREAYIAENPESAGRGIDAFVHCLQKQEAPAASPENPIVTAAKQFVPAPKDPGEAALKAELNKLIETTRMKWDIEDPSRSLTLKTQLPKGMDLSVVRSNFDVEYYLANNPSVAESGVDPFLHFMAIGCLEGRDPAPNFSISYYLRKNKDVAKSRLNPYAHYLQHGRKESWRSSATAQQGKVLNFFDTDPAIIEHIAAAEKLEPMISHPRGARKCASALDNNGPLTKAAEAIRLAVGPHRYRYVVTVPNIRMSGAARVAAIFSEALSQVRDPSEILIVVTDSDDLEYQDWFPESVRRITLAPMISHLGEELKMRCLLDLLRGVAAETLININSRLFWDTLQLFGRQMSQEYRIATYFFTWDETPSGARGGYPIQWLRNTVDYHHLLMTDTKALAQDISDRLGFAPTLGDEEVLPLYTPIAPTQFAAVVPAQGARPRVLWAGRFDRQKRVDILVAIARENPHIDFDVYGKAVLDKDGIESLDPPENLHVMGTYTDLAEVLEVPYHGFLYTAQWDGLPTILLDMARAGLPIVAPDVGGISELIGEDTGWLVPDFTDVAAFSQALSDMVSDPAGAQAKATALKAFIDDTFSEQRYVSAIEEALARHDM